MKWLYAVQQKMRIALLLAVVLLLVFLKGMFDRYHVSELGDSFSSIYEDRLVVESYIYKLSDHLYQKQLLMEQCSQGDRQILASRIAHHNQAIFRLIQDYEKTRLTTQESTFFENFKTNMKDMVTLEEHFLNSQKSVEDAQLNIQFATATQNLNQLSSIQVEEGKNMTNQSQKIITSSSMLTQFELAMLIVIGLIIQALVFASKSMVPKVTQNHQLN